MRKLIILTIFLTLGAWSQAQTQKVARYVGGVEIGRKYVSGNLVWEKQTTPTAQFTMTTNSTSSTWGGENIYIENSGSMHWIVTGAVDYDYVGYIPTFDFSVEGVKYITVMGDITEIQIPGLDITDLDFSGLPNLINLYAYDNNLTVINIPNLTYLHTISLDNNSLTRLDLSNVSENFSGGSFNNNQISEIILPTHNNIIAIDLNHNNLTYVDVSSLQNIRGLYLDNNNFTTESINAILDQLIGFGLSGQYFTATNQTPPACADAAKIAALDTIWTTVYVDACEEPTEWDYEGVMTVGESGELLYGYANIPNDEIVFGSIYPSPSFAFDEGFIYYSPSSEGSFLFINFYYLGNSVFTNENITISIDGVEYMLTIVIGESYSIAVGSNPFPAVGETCDIKLKYTLANPTVTIGGEEYETVTIGTQTWLKRNLHYNDSGGGIYSHNDDTQRSDEYGYLYTWDAAMRIVTLVEGWHLPTYSEFQTLVTYLGGSSVAGSKLKEVGLTHWASQNTDATNESGFTAYGGGYYGEGTYNEWMGGGYFWSGTSSSADASWLGVFNDFPNASVGNNSRTKTERLSVRLIKNTP